MFGSNNEENTSDMPMLPTDVLNLLSPFVVFFDPSTVRERNTTESPRMRTPTLQQDALEGILQ